MCDRTSLPARDDARHEIAEFTALAAPLDRDIQADPILLGQIADWAAALSVLIDAMTGAFRARNAALEALAAWPDQRNAWAGFTRVSLANYGQLLSALTQEEAHLGPFAEMMTSEELRQRFEEMEGANG